jgi:hypothetical protein
MPYNPGVESRGGELIGRGISAGIRNAFAIYTMFAGMGEQKKEQQKIEAKEASNLRGLLDVYDPDGKDAHKAMGLNDLRQKGSAIAAMQSKQQGEAMNEQRGALADFRRQQTSAFETQQRSNSALAGFAQDYGASLQGQVAPSALSDYYEATSAEMPNMPTAQAPQQAFGAALQRYPEAFGNPQFNDNLKALQAFASPDGAGPSFFEDSATGQRFAVMGNTMSPSGMNPEKVSKEGFAQYDKQGNLLGHSIPNGKGGFIFRGQKNASAELKPATVDGKPVKGIFVTSDGKTLDLRGNLDKLRGDGGAAPAPAAADPAATMPDRNKVMGWLQNLFGADPTPVAARAPGSTVERPPDPPAVGTVKGGYRFNGKFPPSDPRAWDKLPDKAPPAE